MELQCPSCYFVVSPASSAQEGDPCPLCNRPLAHQPSPTKDESVHGIDSMPTSTQDDMSGNPLQEGILGDWQNRAKRDESFASVHHAGEFDIPGTPESPLGYNPAQPTHKFIVTGDGSVFDHPEPTHHEYIAQTLGDTEAHLKRDALGQLYSNGGTNWFSNGTRLDPEELSQALSDHFGYPVEVDPSHPGLRQTHEQRFALPEPPLNSKGRPFGYYDNPYINRGGSTHFETEAIGIPGHTTFDATPPSTGLHGEVVGALGQLGAYVNGRKVDPQNDPEYGDQLRNDAYAGSAEPVMVSHPDPEQAELAREVIEQGHSGPLMDYAQKKEAAYPATLRTPNGITDNLHKTLGNLRAWVENPYENGHLRPYYNSYHTIIRPALNQRGSFRIGVQNPQMGEIINHVAQTDDMGPLYEYRGKSAHRKTAGGFLAAPALALGAGGAEAAGAGALGAGALGAGAEAAGAGALGGAAEAGAGGVGGLMNGALGQGIQRGVGWQMGKNLIGGGGGGGGPQQGGQPAQQGAPTVHDPSYYAATDEDSMSPSSHGEIPKNDDGDSNQKADGDNHEWQKQYDVNDAGGTDMSPKFEPGSPAIERFMMMLPLIEQFFNSEESGANDPLLMSLDQALEGEMPGYKDHADDNAAVALLTSLKGGGEDKNDDGDIEGEPTKISEGDDEKRESRVDFLPYLPTLEPSRLPHVGALPATIPANIGPSFPGQTAGPASPTVQGHCPHCAAILDPNSTTCPQCGAATGALPGHFQQMQGKIATPPHSFLYEEPGLDSDIQPGVTADQFRQFGPNMATPPTACQGCGSHIDQGDLVCNVCGTEQEPGGKTHFGAAQQGPHTPEQISVVQQYLIDQNRIDEIPDVPLHPENYADVLSQLIGQDNPPDPTDPTQQAPPQPAQMDAPPEATMPMPGMSAPQQMQSAVQRYADEHHPHTEDPIAADRHLQHDIREEQDTGHTWLDDQGNPLQVGMYYELHSKQYDIPDLVRIDAVKPDSITYVIQGNQGLEHGTEVQKEEANIMGYTFTPSADGANDEVQPEGLEENNDDNTSYEGSPEMTDLSSPHQALSATASSREWLNETPTVSDAPGLEWLNDGSFSPKQAGKQFSQWEQRGFIEEKGVARNADKLDLSNTHYEAFDADDDQFLFGW